VGVTVQHQVRAVVGDRMGEPVTAEEGGDLRYAYAKPFFTLAEELGVAERPDGAVVSGAEVRAAQESRHGH
jgi:hypothetical protein